MVSDNSGNYLHLVWCALVIEYGKFSVIRQLSCTPRVQVPHWDIPSENIVSSPSLRVQPDVQIWKVYQNRITTSQAIWIEKELCWWFCRVTCPLDHPLYYFFSGFVWVLLLEPLEEEDGKKES